MDHVMANLNVIIALALVKKSSTTFSFESESWLYVWQRSFYFMIKQYVYVADTFNYN